ncbi:MAG: hypothetical protein M3422_22510, partial [Actinomycetota bacterium]|nr:hypothetical protein [Actinomycetota bacterium]
FPAGVVPTAGGLTFSQDDLAHALFTTGRAPGDEYAFGNLSVHEWRHRTALVPAYVRRTYGAGLVRSDLALTLDRSEVVALSYALGQAMTAIFCRTQLGVTHLLHMDRYAGHYGVAFGATRRRADLFGTASKRWVVAEAKGRTGSVSKELRRKLVSQKRSVATIEGVAPWITLGCVALFPRRDGPMRLEAFDPEEDAEDAIALNVTRDRFMLAYYAPFLRVLDVAGQGRDDFFYTAELDESGVRVRLAVSIVDRVRRALDQPQGLYGDVLVMLEELQALQLGALPDGSVIEANWQDMSHVEG